MEPSNTVRDQKLLQVSKTICLAVKHDGAKPYTG